MDKKNTFKLPRL